MAKVTKPKQRQVKRSTPKRKPRKILDAKKHAGSIPGMSEWALEEVRQMRDEW